MGKLELVGGGGGGGFDEDDDDDDQSTSSPCFKFRYDVFISFRGEDTRHGFTANLYKNLKDKGIRTFLDDQELERGGEIHESLLTAIEDSATSIAVISPNYANSGWCLEELSKILEFRRLLLPVFYQVDPSHVRHLKGTFGDHFRIHELKFCDDPDKVLRWKKAMEIAGGTAGWDSKNWDEPHLIQSLVKEILTKLSKTPLSVAKHPIGIQSRVEQVVRLLNMDSNGGVEAVGFHGMGGIGKTTLAKAVYNKIVTQFEHRSFISDIRQVSEKINGLASLQEKLIRNLFPDDTFSPSVDEVGKGIRLIKQRIYEKKVLVVLDDVDDISQLDALAGSKDWFHAGSRIIITTRDSTVLKQNLVNEMFEVKELNLDESLQLFSYHAFSREKPTKDFMKLSAQVVSLTGQLPLALEVIGTFFFDKRRIKEWEDALEKFKHTRPRNLHDVLMISFNALDYQEKCIFLDIACFFVGMEMERENAIDILKGCGFNAEIAITVLTARSLVKTVDNKLRMHDQLRDMGRQLVLEESPRDAGMRTRLWNHDEIMNVLRYEKGTRNIEGIIFSLEKNNTPSRSQILNQRNSVLSYIVANLKNIFRLGSEIETEEVHVHTKPFAPMLSLRLLQINHLKLEGTFKFIPGELKWLEWKNCPLEALPSDFCPSELAVLDLSGSKIKQVWAQSWWIWWRRYKMAEKLIVLNLSGCCNLTATPDFSRHPCLEKLILERCTSLVEIHKSIGDMRTLRTLNLKDCSSLVEFPNDISGLRNLENFVLSGCSKLKELPKDLSSFKCLSTLLADGTAIRKLPDSISRLKRLERLSLNRCTSLKQLPNTIGQLRSLTELSLNDSAIEAIPDSIGNLINLKILSIMRCRSTTTIPDSIGNLESLVELLLDGTTFEELPDSMFLLSRLKHLSLGSCRSLKQLPASVGGLVSLVELCMDKTSITELPDEIGNLTILKKLEMRDCELLSRLPDSIKKMSSLTTFLLMNANITELPESIGLLKKLEVLNVNNCKRLSRLPTSFGELESLRELRMERTGVTYLPKEFGMLSRLMVLKMGKRPPYPRDIEDHTKTSLLNQKEDPKFVVLPDEFSNLSLLYDLDASYCKISGIIPDAFEKLSSLEDLKLNHNNFCRLPSSLRGLVHLKQLSLSHCTKLKLLPPLPSSLDFLDVTNCTALESISDLSNLENLLEMRLTNCKKVTDIPGLKCLSLLKRLYLGGCNACFTSIRKRLHKVALERLRNLCVPGSEIPSWLIQEVPSFLRPRNREIKGVIICVVISLQHQQYPDDLRSELPAIVDIQAKIIRNSLSIFTTTLYLIGVPDTSEDQIHLCRYVHFHPLVSLLEEGDNIQVAMRNPPIFQGLHLKKYGIHLVFEDDDDIDDDDETKLSVTGRLENYVSVVA